MQSINPDDVVQKVVDELAEIVAVTYKTSNSIENRKYIPSTYLALKLANALVTSVENLFQIEA